MTLEIIGFVDFWVMFVQVQDYTCRSSGVRYAGRGVPYGALESLRRQKGLDYAVVYAEIAFCRPP